MSASDLSQILEPYSLTVTQAVQWGEMDAYLHVNNITYFRYFENARIEYFEHTGINAYKAEHKIGPILGHTECKYLAPLTWPEEISIGIRIVALREKRFTMENIVYSHKQDKAVAVGTAEIVYFDYDKHCSTVIPDELVEKLKAFEAGKIG